MRDFKWVIVHKQGSFAGGYANSSFDIKLLTKLPGSSKARQQTTKHIWIFPVFPVRKWCKHDRCSVTRCEYTGVYGCCGRIVYCRLIPGDSTSIKLKIRWPMAPKQHTNRSTKGRKWSKPAHQKNALARACQQTELTNFSMVNIGLLVTMWQPTT